jgi:hypothetical protein
VQTVFTNSSWSSLLFFATAILLLWFGWKISPEAYLTAEKGLGYLLGIIGASLMALLLLYPLRKNRVFPFRFGAIRYWFRIHMTFGVLGPIAILYHANFQLGSVNSNIALFCMLLVASSGLAGRYFYTRIHHGLYGARTTLGELQQNLVSADHQIGDLFGALPELSTAMRKWEQRILQRKRGKFMGLLLLPWSSWRMRVALEKKLAAQLTEHPQTAQWSKSEYLKHLKHGRQFIGRYIETIRRVAEVGMYERLFSWWHIFHMPLFIMMLISGVVHILAVHIY